MPWHIGMAPKGESNRFAMPVDTDHMRHEGSKVSASTADFGQQTDSDLERFQEKWAPQPGSACFPVRKRDKTEVLESLLRFRIIGKGPSAVCRSRIA